jgi:hypothetical protein
MSPPTGSRSGITTARRHDSKRQIDLSLHREKQRGHDVGAAHGGTRLCYRTLWVQASSGSGRRLTTPSTWRTGPCVDAAVRSMPARLLLCLLLRSSWLTVDGGRQVSAARARHRRGGRAVAAVSVGVAGGVPFLYGARPRGHSCFGQIASHCPASIRRRRLSLARRCGRVGDALGAHSGHPHKQPSARALPDSRWEAAVRRVDASVTQRALGLGRSRRAHWSRALGVSLAVVARACAVWWCSAHEELLVEQEGV